MGLRTDINPRNVYRERLEPVSPSEMRQSAPAAEAGPISDADVVRTVLEQLEDSPERALVEVEGHRIAFTNLNKPLWPEADGHPAITKGDMIRYYARISPALLPHLRNRPPYPHHATQTA